MSLTSCWGSISYQANQILKWNNGGIHLTGLTTTYSMDGNGGLPSDFGGVRTAFQVGAVVSGLLVPASVAGRVSLSALRRHQGVAAEPGLVAVCELRPQSLGDGRNDLPGYAHAAHGLVPGDVVGDCSEERRQRPGTPTGVGSGQLPDCLGLAA